MGDKPTPDLETPLTDSELQVLQLIDQGFSNKEIARTLNLNLATVKNHVHSILAKYRVSRRAQAAAQYRMAVKDKPI